MRIFFFIIFIISLSSIKPDDIDLSTYYKTYIKEFGFDLEVHDVETEDGYILSLWHLVPQGPTDRVALFFHGLSDTSWGFFQMEDKSLPFLLSKEGFDVWLPNVRGNIFSDRHKVINSSDETSFYDYSMDEHVKYDLPSIISYIKSKTGGKKMSYIAHSQGSTIFFMAYMHNPELIESSFDHFTSVGTVPNIAHTDFTPVKILDVIYKFFDKIEFDKGIVLSDSQRKFISKVCKIAPAPCKYIVEKESTITPTGRTNYDKLYNFLYYYPGGMSKNSLLHWSQIHKEKKLVYFNPNFEDEQTSVPYDTSILAKWKIKALVARSDDDSLSSYDDVTDLYNLIEDKSYIELLDLKNYGHLDVLDAESAYEDIFIPMINFLKS